MVEVVETRFFEETSYWALEVGQEVHCGLVVGSCFNSFFMASHSGQIAN